GKTILISSHILTELTDLCTHVGIVARGRMLREGPLGDVLWAVERPGYVVRVLEPAERAAEVLSSVNGVGQVTIDDPTGDVHFRCDGDAETAARAAAAVVQAGLHLARFGEVEGSLEATFMRLARDGEASHDENHVVA